MRSNRPKAWLSALVIGGLLMGTSVPVAGAGPRTIAADMPHGTVPAPAAISVHWGYVVARHPSRSHYTPGPKDQRSIGPSDAFIDRLGVGSYRITFPSLSVPGAVQQVTALGPTTHFCDAYDLGNGVSDESLFVRCFTRHGVAADTAFAVNMLQSSDGTGKVGHAFASDVVSPSYTPNNQYDSAGGTVHATNDGTGASTIVFPNLGTTGGSVQVTASDLGTTCHVASWGAAGVGGANLRVHVSCRGFDGALVSAHYMLTFIQGTGLQGTAGEPAAYVFSDRLHPPLGYHPPANRRFSSTHMAPIVNRTGVGHYQVTLPGEPNGGAAQVTAYGTGKARCNLASIRTSGLPQVIGVSCWDAHGLAVDSRFTFAYMH